MQQFPSPVLSELAKCVAFVAGSFAAWVLFMAALSDVVLERPLFGHTLVWCAPRLAGCHAVMLCVARCPAMGAPAWPSDVWGKHLAGRQVRMGNQSCAARHRCSRPAQLLGDALTARSPTL